MMSMRELIASKAKLINFVVAVLLLLWGAYGLYVNELLISSVDEGKPTYLMFAALICGAMIVTAGIIEEVEIKNSEPDQPSFSSYVGWSGWAIFATVLGLHMTLEAAQTLLR